MKKKITTEWYSLKNVLKYDTSYIVVYGERSNGKTYSAKQYIIDRAILGEKFVYMRRRHTHIVRPKMVRLFEDISEYSQEKLGDYIHFKNDIGFYINGNDVIGYPVCVEDSYLIKGIPFEGVTTIVFDEFIDYEYMSDEITKFLHIISTIVRDRKNIKIIMLGNTVNKFCPYFELLGIDVNKIKQGQIGYITHKRGATVAVEYCKSHSIEGVRDKKHDYLGFDENESVNMILYGDWEHQHSNITNIDGIGWSCKNRYLIPIYLTALEKVYEMTIYTGSEYPICFVRSINTQQGRVSKNIKLNLSYDNSLTLTNSNGIVPIVSKINSLVNEKIKSRYDIFVKTFEIGRIVFDTIETGSTFTKIFKEIM